ncbi:hypothetical protein JCM3765_006229 [Sporobolomyces pararoseus]
MVSTRSTRIPMTSLTALTLHSDRKTTSRRHPPVPQLTCEGKLCRKYQPDVVQCIKVGEDGVGGLEWKCEADLPKGIRFGEVEVSCEGWDGSEDPFILKGSCGLNYRLVPSSRSLEEDIGGSRLPSSRSPQDFQSSLYNLIFFLLFGYFLLTLLRSFLFPALANLRRFFSSRQPPRSFSNFWPGGGGGGGFPPGGGGPPPPYTPKPSTGSNEQTGGWRPGFWSGLAAGAAANHLLRPRTNETPRFVPRTGWGNTMGGVGGGMRERPNWGFGGGRGNLRDNDDDWDRGVGGSGLSRSTGFGGTRNR